MKILKKFLLIIKEYFSPGCYRKLCEIIIHIKISEALQITLKKL